MIAVNVWDVLICAALLLAVIFAVRSVIRARKQKKCCGGRGGDCTGCSGNCGGCARSAQCEKPRR